MKVSVRLLPGDAVAIETTETSTFDELKATISHHEPFAEALKGKLDQVKLYHFNKGTNEDVLLSPSALVSSIPGLTQGDTILLKIDSKTQEHLAELRNSTSAPPAYSPPVHDKPSNLPPNLPPNVPVGRSSRRAPVTAVVSPSSSTSKKERRTSSGVVIAHRPAISMLQAKGGFITPFNNKDKFEPYKCSMSWGMFYLFDLQTGKLLDIIPLTNTVLGEINKKDKLTEKNIFVLVDQKKKTRTIFLAETEADIEIWSNALKANLDLVTPNVFNTTIADGCMKSCAFVPKVVSQCINYIDQFLDVEGLFRVPGNKKDITKFQETYDKGEEVSFQDQDVHLAGGLLKLYFRELKEPLFPLPAYTAIIDLWKKKPEDQRLEAIKSLISKDLPSTNRIVLCCLLQFLRRVTSQSSKNKMDISNIALVFAPTLFRSADEKEVNVDSMGATAEVMKFLLTHNEKIFSNDDVERISKPYFHGDEDIVGERPTMSDTEKGMVEAVLRDNYRYESGVWENAFCALFNVTHPKCSGETRLIVCDKIKTYIFFKGKLELDFHWLDLVKISSPNKNSATFIYQNIEKKKLQFSIVPICYATFDIDNLIYWINKHFENTFISIPSPKKFELELAPPERKEKLERVEVPDQSVGCGGFELTYLSVCNFLKQEVQDRMLWEIQNFYYPNKIKEFNIKDLIPKPKFPNPEFQACVQSLYYNTWFKQFISNGIILRDESAQMLARVFSTNKTFNELVLTDAGLTKVGIGYLIAAFLENPNINIEKLDLSGNSIDLKVLKEFMECVTGALAAKLTHLDISNLQIPRHGLKLVFDSLGGTVSLVNALTHLKISKNKLDSESSSRLGVFLSLTRALTTFHISATTPNFKNVVASMMVGDKSLSNLTVTELDCSFNVPAKERPEFLQFLKNFPNLTDLNISGTTITVEELISVLKVDHSISKLNVSENNFTDQEIIEFAKFLATPENSIKTLLMNKVWRRATPDRPKAIEQLVNALNNSKIEEFQLKGDRGSSALRDDLIDLIFGLLTNQNLKIIDVSGHQAGDDLAIALSKVLARNSVLHTIYWDFNEISLSGLQAVKLGLNRNYSIRHLELPFMDIFELRNRLDAPEKDVLVTTIQEIQKIVSEISQKATLSSSKKPAGIPTGITYSQIHKASIYFRQSKMMATMEEKPEPKT